MTTKGKKKKVKVIQHSAKTGRGGVQKKTPPKFQLDITTLKLRDPIR